MILCAEDSSLFLSSLPDSFLGSRPASGAPTYSISEPLLDTKSRVFRSSHIPKLDDENETKPNPPSRILKPIRMPGAAVSPPKVSYFRVNHRLSALTETSEHCSVLLASQTSSILIETRFLTPHWKSRRGEYFRCALVRTLPPSDLSNDSFCPLWNLATLLGTNANFCVYYLKFIRTSHICRGPFSIIKSMEESNKSIKIS